MATDLVLSPWWRSMAVYFLLPAAKFALLLMIVPVLIVTFPFALIGIWRFRDPGTRCRAGAFDE